jgi:myo-inositol-1(or 4)-monophosphatase
MKELLIPAQEITREAGAKIMQFYRSAINVTEKSPDNPVTEADLTSDTYLRENLTALLPEAGWLSEETVDSPERLDKAYLWVVDPLDGTKEFVYGISEFSVSVALVHQGLPVLGIIYNPATKEMVSGAKGQGVTLNAIPAVVSPRTILAGATVDASRSEMKRGEFDPFKDHLNLKVTGSIAYKLARVSVGVSDATWSRGPKHEWDICAGHFLVEEAGGTCVDLDNRPLTYNKHLPKANDIIANNDSLHKQIVAELAPYGAARTEPGL